MSKFSWAVLQKYTSELISESLGCSVTGRKWL